MELYRSRHFLAGVQLVAAQASAEVQSEPAAVVGPDETAPFPAIVVVAVGFAADESGALPTVHEAVLVAAEAVQAVLVVVKAVLVTSGVG